jgi:hypothetical protein
MSEPSEAMFSTVFWIRAYGIITAGAEFAAPIAGSRLGTTLCAFKNSVASKMDCVKNLILRPIRS